MPQYVDGRLLKELRTLKRKNREGGHQWTQEYVADLANIATRTYQYMETRENLRFDERTISNVAHALGVESSTLCREARSSFTIEIDEHVMFRSARSPNTDGWLSSNLAILLLPIKIWIDQDAGAPVRFLDAELRIPDFAGEEVFRWQWEVKMIPYGPDYSNPAVNRQLRPFQLEPGSGWCEEVLFFSDNPTGITWERFLDKVEETYQTDIRMIVTFKLGDRNVERVCEVAVDSVRLGILSKRASGGGRLLLSQCRVRGTSK